MQLRRLTSLVPFSPDEGGGATPPPETPPAASTSTDPPSGSTEGGDTQAGTDAATGGDTQTGTDAQTGTDTQTGADALNVVPASADAYQLTLSDAAKAKIGADDPALKKLRETALAEKWTQGQFEERLGPAISLLEKAGLLQANFDPAAETAKLSEGGKDGKARQQDVQVFADALLARKDIDDAEYAELMSLAPTAAGVRLIEKLKAMNAVGATPPGGGGDGGASAKDQARAMRADPKYDKDPLFRKQADAAYLAAFQR